MDRKFPLRFQPGNLAPCRRFIFCGCPPCHQLLGIWFIRRHVLESWCICSFSLPPWLSFRVLQTDCGQYDLVGFFCPDCTMPFGDSTMFSTRRLSKCVFDHHRIPRCLTVCIWLCPLPFKKGRITCTGQCFQAFSAFSHWWRQRVGSLMCAVYVGKYVKQRSKESDSASVEVHHWLEPPFKRANRRPK